MQEVSHRIINDQRSDGSPEHNVPTDESVVKIIWEHFSENRIELFHQFTRILSICFSFFCFLNVVQADSLWNTRVTRYQKALLAGASSHALTMHLSVDNIPDSGILSMDSFHFLIYCYILCSSQPSLVALIPLCVWALLELADYFFELLTGKLPPQHQVIKATSAIRECRGSLLQLVAYVEIFIAIVIIPWIFFTDINFLVLAYYKYLQYRYQGQNNHSRVAFRKCKHLLEATSQQAQCPEKLREVIEKIIDIVMRLSPFNVPDDVPHEH